MFHVDLPAHGRFADGAHVLPVRVYYEDTDAGGIVYHASYIRFLERGRTEFLRARGLVQSAMAAADDRLLFVVRHMDIDFRRPSRLDDVLTVTTSVRDLSGARIVLDQAIACDGVTVMDARVTVAAIGDSGKPRRLTATLRQQFLGD